MKNEKGMLRIAAYPFKEMNLTYANIKFNFGTNEHLAAETELKYFLYQM
jgi:hypothetical protein